jgi:hypothetical protein
MLRTCSRIIALTAMVAAPSMTAQAADAVLTLSCDGTVTRLTDDDKTERIANWGLLVNLPEHTVSGFSHVARINMIGEVYVDFSGQSGNWSIHGSIDRITGRVSATTRSEDSKTGRSIDQRQWNLICKPAKRLF